MPGFLDPLAPSAAAEYSRYLDGDLLGKLIAKNFLVNRIGCEPSDVRIPLGRYGDVLRKYGTPGKVAPDLADGSLVVPNGVVTFEVKCARVSIANRHAGGSTENWAFVNVRTTPQGVPKAYDVLIAIGISTLGLEDERYWEHLRELEASLRQEGVAVQSEALPHEQEFLSLCTFFIMPLRQVPTNYFRVATQSVETSKFAEYRARGYDLSACRRTWEAATRAIGHDV